MPVARTLSAMFLFQKSVRQVSPEEALPGRDETMVVPMRHEVLGTPLRPITTANFDFVQHYRGRENVVVRPTREGRGSRGFAITGHHEILLPLLAAALVESDAKPRRKTKRKK